MKTSLIEVVEKAQSMTKSKDKISRQSSGDLKEPICIVEFNFLAVLSLYGLGFTDFFLYGLK